MSKNNNRMIRPQDEIKLPAYYPPAYYEEQPYVINQPEEDKINLLDLWRILVKRKWIIASLVSASLIITAIGTWQMTPVYKATVRLQIDPELQNVLPFKDAADYGATYANSQEYLQTQFKVLESSSLAQRVIKVLNLESNEVFAGKADAVKKSSGIFSWFNSKKSAQPEDPAVKEEQKRQRLINKFNASLSTSPIRSSRLVDVSFESTDAKLAAEVANTLAQQYILMNFDTKYSAANAASDFLAGKLIDLKARVEKSEEALVAFSRQHDIYAISDKENVSLQKLADLSSALTAAQSERIQKESIWKIVQQTAAGNYPEILRTDMVKKLEENVTQLRLQKISLEVQFNRRYPELAKVADQLTEAERELQQQRQRSVKNTETEYFTALQREKLLNEALESQKTQVDVLNQNSIQYNILQRQVETDKQLYEGLLQRMKEAGVSAGLQSNNIHVVDAAETPQSPRSPNKSRNLALGLVIGLLLGVGMAFFIEYLDNSIKTTDDIDRYLELPSLGVIPALDSLNGNRSGRRRLAVKSYEEESEEGVSSAKKVELISHYDGKSLIAEAYRNLRASLLLSSGSGHPPRVLLVASSQSSEGKTTSSMNIAITLAQTDKRVVLLDCDMRKPRVHKVLNLDNRNGMSSYLSGNSELANLIQKSEMPNLFAITAGPIPPNPAEMVGSLRMKQALEKLAEEFEYIIIDSPPVLAVSDARLLAALADGVVLVIKGGETPREAVLQAKRLLMDVHSHLLGTLLNNVDVRSADYYYSSYYHYGYGYSYGYEQNNEEK